MVRWRNRWKKWMEDGGMGEGTGWKMVVWVRGQVGRWWYG